jgi:murein DD-endopeptidase MepM/ murein hydrolase activator NlpD
MIDSHSHPQKKHSLSILVLFLFCLVFCTIDGRGTVEPEFHSPFNDPNRQSFRSIERRVVGSYGDYRKSYKPGHLHAGIDLEGAFNETIYAIGSGKVHMMFRSFPHQSVIIEHWMSGGDFLYSVYTHVEQIQVKVGDWVDENTPIARLFNQDELKRANFGTPNHLHLEIRKSIADEGRASYASMTRQELDKFCMDPMEFFKTRLTK